MAIRPSGKSFLSLKGTFKFKVEYEPLGIIEDSFELVINVGEKFPHDIPCVKELGRKIPRNGLYHISSDDTLCLGSPLRLLLLLSQNPTLDGFAKNCIEPYLFAVSWKLQHGGSFPFGELDHEVKGVLSDYMDIFGLGTPDQVRASLRMLGMKKRIANKFPCPCGCGRVLGQCKFNLQLAKLRLLAPRAWFQTQKL